MLCVFPARSDSRAIAVQRTGLTGYCDELRFYASEKTPESDVIEMSMDTEVEAHNNMWEKVWRMFERVAEDCDYDWVIKADLDTLLFPQNFRRMLRENPKLQESKFLGHGSAHTFPDMDIYRGSRRSNMRLL